MTFWNNLSNDIRILLVLAAYCLPFMLMTGVYTFRDAKRCGRNPVKWTFISVFGPCLLGFIIYLLTRDPNSVLECANCETPVKMSDTVCAKCGAHLQPVCPECGNAVDVRWKQCPNCGGAVDAQLEIIAPVRRTNRMLWQILIAIILVPSLLVGFVSFSMSWNATNNLFLTRYDTQAELVDGFLDIAYYDTDAWYGFTRRNVDGSTVSVKQGFDYVIEKTAADGTEETINWKVASGGVYNAPWGKYADLHGETFHELVGNLNTGEVQTWGAYYRNEQDQIYLYQLQWGNAPTDKQNLHYRTELFYDDQGRIIKQLQENEEYNAYFTLLELSPEESNLRYVTYTYDASDNVIRSEQFDYLDEMVGYTDYTWAMDDTIRIARNYDAGGTLLDHSVSQFNEEGKLLRQEFYDETGNLCYTVEFDYDPVSYLLLPNKMLIIVTFWATLMLVTVLMLLPWKKKR